MESGSLTSIEQNELLRLETIIEKGLEVFFEVGGALMLIREKRLYSPYRTFEEYCNKRWKFTQRYAECLILSHKVYRNLEQANNCSPLPSNEAQTRPLTHLNPPQQREAWKKAVETAPEGKVTAKHVETVVRKYKEPKPTQTKTEAIQEDSDALFQMKRWWKLATKKDRKAFMNWVESQEGGRA